MQKLALGIFGALLMCLNAYAAEINLGVVMKDLDGKDVVECVRADAENPQKCAETATMTVAKLAVRALATRFQDEANLPAEEQVMRGALAVEIYRTPKIDLKPEQVALIRKLIPKLGLSTIIVYQAFQALDPPAPAKK